ncbi:MAG: Glucose-6-phosphate isomerase [Thermodesulfobacterium sp. 37_54]|uniref:Glucose-6-phosphate isomerase n=1 Tax=Thermodesulfobacterium commune DSM 2178 TaxID=289377 RepID=A0A075WYL1_9BACT|nr:phosphoheptose isomerase [Thermodesulfobacterium commune]KUJ97363.1 MAG: Glucose-6-phosphate isomerase [Thermodesulfobacterium sp. 37_54]MDK2861212.1 transaldolase / glucose-6-phosphate isomerase [Thermodesulfobacterium sp.]AIH03722.1 phosphoheptose isomerase [Thermodesulfobacterium commune DSM 2178]KUK18997.1 MAG: Glucose-6-phosphate isomerase [Thermodesulfobacterium commune]KUK37538.1 MAG: Glucose-6-phosphate isomerase [Thermodesulfobacterium commune]
MSQPPKIVKTYRDFGHIKRPRTLSNEQKQELLQRLFQKDASLFSSDPAIQEKIKKRLDWIDGVTPILPKIKNYQAFAEEVKSEFSHIVWCGMGGSALFPLVLGQMFGPQPGYPQFLVVDTNDPEIIKQVENLPLERTLFFIVSKSGTTLETLSHLKYFWQKLEEKGLNPGNHFVALTDQGSPLEELAKELGFRKVFPHPLCIGGRYAALSEIGFLPAALMGLDLNKALSYAQKMYEACHADIPWGYNLAASLAEFLVEAYVQGQDKISFITDPLLKPFALWLEQLLAESLGKNLTGLVPIVGESPGSPTVYGNDRTFIYLTLKGREKIYQRLISDLTEEGFRVKTYVLDERYEIFAEAFRWMLAIALCGYFLTLNPFDEPDVVLTKEKTRNFLEKFKQDKDFGIELYLDESTGISFYYEDTISIEFPRFSALLKKFFKDFSPWSYVGFLAYLPPTSEIEDIFRDFRTLVRERRNCSTVFGFGPRYLHSTGQMHKGGPILSRFMIFTRKGRNPEQIIPGEGYTFWDQQFAQACGDFKSLVEKKKPVILIHLTENYKEDLKIFYHLLEKALSFE